MKNLNEPTVVAPVAIIPDQVGLDCPVCALTHLLWRGLDFDEAPDGRWRCTEAGGFVDTYECDCGVLLAVAFTLTVQPAPMPVPAPDPRPK